MNETERIEILSKVRDLKVEYANLELYVVNDDKSLIPYNLFVFYIPFKTYKELDKLWEPISNDIAINVQVNIEKAIELWNFYIFYFIEESIMTDDSKALKYRIENDTYSARKIVVDKVNSDFKNEIDKKLTHKFNITETYNSRGILKDILDEKIIKLSEHVRNKKIDSEFLINFLNEL